jgi:hypothetical protein
MDKSGDRYFFVGMNPGKMVFVSWKSIVISYNLFLFLAGKMSLSASLFCLFYHSPIDHWIILNVL